MFETQESDVIEYEGDNGTVHLAETRVKLEAATDANEAVTWSYNYVVGFQIDEDDILSDFHDTIDEIAVNLFIQLGIYLLFLVVVFVVAFFLARIIVRNIVNPIDKLV